MSYIVYADGWLNAKNKDMGDKVFNILNESKIFYNVQDDLSFYEDFNYFGDAEHILMETLKKIIPYIDSGEIEFKSEENCYWKYQFQDNKWYSMIGEITYNEANKKAIIEEEIEEPNIEEDTEELG